MNCPRCGASAPADLATCPACAWGLAHPFTGTPTAVRPGRAVHTSAVPVPATPMPTVPRPAALDPFVLTPPAATNHQHPLRRRRSLLGHRRPDLPPTPALTALLESPHAPHPQRRGGAAPRLALIQLAETQTTFDFDAAEEADRNLLALGGVAPLGVRTEAALLDAVLVLAASGVFFGLFALLGGHLGFGRRDLLIYLLAVFSLASLYCALFTCLGGRTPGMQHYHLRAVTFEGKPLPFATALWRAFGYIVSAGALMLGFLWALVDERHLTWHDTISRSFITDRPAL